MKKQAYISSGRDRPRQCPVCLRAFDAATGVEVREGDEPAPGQPIRPKPGDLTICVYCGAALVFTRHNCRIATQAEYDNLQPDLKTLIADFQQQHVKRQGH